MSSFRVIMGQNWLFLNCNMYCNGWCLSLIERQDDKIDFTMCAHQLLRSACTSMQSD